MRSLADLAAVAAVFVVLLAALRRAGILGRPPVCESCQLSPAVALATFSDGARFRVCLGCVPAPPASLPARQPAELEPAPRRLVIVPPAEPVAELAARSLPVLPRQGVRP